MNEPDFSPLEQADSTSWDYPVCTRDTLWRQHYVITD